MAWSYQFGGMEMKISIQGVLSRGAVCAALLCSLTNSCFGAEAQPNADVAPPGEEVARELAAAFQETQADRLLRSGGRDDLIAAALISFSPGTATARRFNDSELVQRLATEHSTDLLAVYVAALLCNTQKSPCLHPEYRQQLLKLDPGNAIHWLIVPSGGRLTSQELRRSSESKLADTHFSEMLGIVRRSLEGQGPGDSAPPEWRGNKELGLMLRQNEIARVPWPNYTQMTAACNAQAALSAEEIYIKRECAKLGALLIGEEGRNIVTQMFGSTLLRRFSRNTPAAAAAIRLRRQYVWMSEQRPDNETSEQKERLNEEEILLGEWEAYQRNAERYGVPREPPPDWVPKRPEALLLQEERASAPSAGKQ